MRVATAFSLQSLSVKQKERALEGLGYWSQHRDTNHGLQAKQNAKSLCLITFINIHSLFNDAVTHLYCVVFVIIYLTWETFMNFEGSKENHKKFRLKWSKLCSIALNLWENRRLLRNDYLFVSCSPQSGLPHRSAATMQFTSKWLERYVRIEVG